MDNGREISEIQISITQYEREIEIYSLDPESSVDDDDAGLGGPNGHNRSDISRLEDGDVIVIEQYEKILQVEDVVRIGLIRKLSKAFLVVNAAIIGFIFIFFLVDVVMVSLGLMDSSDRLITERVLLTLIGATTVQLGSIVFMLAKHLSKWLGSLD